MKRNIKNLIMILLIIVVCVCSFFTIQSISKVSSSNNIGMEQGQPPEMPTGDSNNMGEPPEKPEQGETQDSNTEKGQPPEMSTGDSNNMEEPPEKPEQGETQDSNTENGQPPEIPTGDSNNNMGEPPTKTGQENSSNQISTSNYIMLGTEGLIISILVIYLIMSKFNKLTLKETLKNANKAIIFILAIIIITAIITVIEICITKNLLTSNSGEMPNNMQMMPSGDSSSSVTKTGATTVDGTTQTLEEDYQTSQADESVILVTNGGNATINGATVSKTGGDSSNTENSEFYGVNSGILVTENSTATIKNATISTNAKGSNALFATGTDSKIYVSDSTITTTGSASARGLDATYGGYIEANNVTITTQGGSCATLATDRGEGTIIAKNSTLETNGSGSPIIYSTGDIRIENTTGTANGAQMVVIEGKNSATVIDSTLSASGKGNRNDTDQAGVMIYQSIPVYTDQAGIMIYQSMSGDAGQGTGTFTAENSTLSVQSDSNYYKTAPMFFITNTDAIINLTNSKLLYGSNILISSKGTSEWGKTGSNGGNTTLNANSQELEGNIEIDEISTLTMNLSNSSYKGTINSDNSAKEINIKLDSNSKITLTGDSYITSLENSDETNSNIDFNGYKLYVNGVAI